MKFFDTILSKLGFGKRDEEPPVIQSRVPEQSRPVETPPPPVQMPEVDVVAKLEGMAQANSQKLNWRTSIVDLLKLLGLDSSLEQRKQLAAELGCPADKMGDSAAMNMWLHKEVLRKLAANGGNIPKDLLD